MQLIRHAFLSFVFTLTAAAQVTTDGFSNLPRTEAPGTLLSHPVTNDSEPIGRTTSINYLNGWIIVGAEVPGSRAGSDLQMRVYDIADPMNPVRRMPSDFGLSYPNNSWIFGNYGWNAHGTAQYGNLLLPDPIRVRRPRRARWHKWRSSVVQSTASLQSQQSGGAMECDSALVQYARHRHRNPPL
jgi:hypothetical protein